MNRNDSPRVSIKLYEITKDIFHHKSILDAFSKDFVKSLISDDDSYVI